MQGLVIAVRISGIKLKVPSVLGAYLVSLERKREREIVPISISFLRELCSTNLAKLPVRSAAIMFCLYERIDL